MQPRSSLAAERALQSIAEEQGGLLTAKQAAALGYRSPHLAYHTRTGRLKQVRHGIYRLTTVPMSEHDQLIELTLWSRNRADEPQATVSHVTALVVHGITDLLPGKVHLTVPPGFRKPPPPVCVLHRAWLEDSDWEQRVGFRVTTPLRTLLDTSNDPVVTRLEFEKSLRRALELGLVLRRDLMRAMNSLPADHALRLALDEIESEQP
jgi:predicted transcriptional regulator of viral defense system